MSLKTGKAKGSYTKVRPSEDNHPALIAQIIDLGSQFNRDYKTQEIQTWDDGNPKINQEIWVTFEFPTQTHTFDEELGEQPLWVSKRYNLKGKPLQELIMAAGFNPDKPMDVSQLGGSCVEVAVGTTSGGNAKITGTKRVKEKMLVDDEVIDTSDFALAKGACQVFDLDSFDTDFYNTLPDFLRDMIDNQASKEVYEVERQEQGSNEEGNF